jgi:hypothetical protein
MADFFVTVTSSANATVAGGDNGRVKSTAVGTVIVTLSERTLRLDSLANATVTVKAQTQDGAIFNGRYRR